ncbi:MAG TPA: hypothetical protein VN618_05185 [Solirubrobacteraceae bacterium]|nr:hypothetical protein [Solirubrobacteraceae bacterium]
MTETRRALWMTLLSACLFAATAGTASAATFYVNQRGGEDTSPCSKAQPCETIKHAVFVAEGVAGPNTIEVEAEGSYEKEAVVLNKATDKGLTINGEEGLIVANETGPVFTVTSPATAITISDMKVARETGAGAAIEETGAEVALKNLFVENGSTGGKNGVEGHKGSIAIEGGTVEMENGASGFGVQATETALTIAGATIKDAGLGEAGGVGSERSGLSISGTKIIQEGGLSEANDGLVAEEDGSVTLHEDSIAVDNKDFAVLLSRAPAHISGLAITMSNKASKSTALNLLETAAVTSTLEHVEIGGTWSGQAMLVGEGNTTLTDSRLTTNLESSSPALTHIGPGEGQGLVIQRSLLQAGPTASRATLQSGNSNVTIDSSEILGGHTGVFFESASGAARTLTVSASTIDAGVPGTVNDAFETTGVEAVGKSSATSAASVAIQGSIVLEPQVAQTLTGAKASVSCAYSDAPLQTQAETPSLGAIGCGASSPGEAEPGPLPALFALATEPISAYGLLAGSPAVDAVPAGALPLPFGIVASSTDLAGAARVVDGNGDCAAAQDKGALELQGHSAPCKAIPGPGKPSPTPVPGTITGLALSPSSFFAAPKGATVSAAKRRYGTKISWRDTQAGTTTFTVLIPVAGRRQGHSCKKPSKANKHGRKCTFLRALGEFTHSDVAGADSLHFSGRLHGRKLARGSYSLRAVPHDAAGNGKGATRAFTIKG